MLAMSAELSIAVQPGVSDEDLLGLIPHVRSSDLDHWGDGVLHRSINGSDPYIWRFLMKDNEDMKILTYINVPGELNLDDIEYSWQMVRDNPDAHIKLLYAGLEFALVLYTGQGSDAELRRLYMKEAGF